jgi:exosortase
LRYYVLLLVLVGAEVWVNRQPLLDILNIGLRDMEQSHIFLAPLVALWLLWLRRSRLQYVLFQPSLWGCAFIAAGWLLSWWGFVSERQLAWHAGALVGMVGALLTMTGMVPLYRLGPVFLVLLFMLPIPGELRIDIAHPMQEMATSVTHSVLQMIGVDSLKSGNVLVINGERVAVGEACNGMRMVFALALVVFAFAFGSPLRTGTRVVLLILSPVIAMLCNVIRLVPTSVIFGYGGFDTARNFHDLAGWVMLPVALMMVWGILKAIQWLEFPVTGYRLASQS